MKKEILYKILEGNCEKILETNFSEEIHLSFLDPPFNQNKKYNSHNDNMPETEYWDWMTRICTLICEKTTDGGVIYFMQREKNTRFVLKALEDSGWTFQNLIIWRKKSSAVPGELRYAKHYQIIAYATKGEKPSTFNKLRIDPPYAKTHYELGYRRDAGMFLTDVWDDIRELTSGFYAGDEPLFAPKKTEDQKKDKKPKERVHKQQSPVALLTRIILSSTKKTDLVFDPFAGTGTTLVVANQLQRRSIGIELDIGNVSVIKNRLASPLDADDITKLLDDYTKLEKANIDKIDQDIQKLLNQNKIWFDIQSKAKQEKLGGSFEKYEVERDKKITKLQSNLKKSKTELTKLQSNLKNQSKN